MGTTQKILKIVINVLLFLVVQDVWALQCLHVFSNSNIEIPGLYFQQKNPKQFETITKVSQLTRQLLIENAAILFPSHAPDFYFQIEHLGVRAANGNYPTYLTKVKYQNLEFIVGIRSNGKVAFLEKTWQYKNKQNNESNLFKAVFFKGKNIESVDQGAAILNSLPEFVVISRTMSDRERQLWIAGETFQSPDYGKRVHFFPNNSPYIENTKPNLIKISKVDLLRFYERGELEINTYDPIASIQLTSIQLHFELVFTGQSAIENLMPIMQSQISAQSFNPQF